MRTLIVIAGLLATILPFAYPSVPLAAPAAVASMQSPLSLPPPKAGRTRPLAVVVAGASGAETTDFIIPYGVLKESGVVEVRSLSMVAGPVQLMGALRVLADQTTDAFDAAEPAGADIVIIPAQMSPKDAELKRWVLDQAAKGATIVSICEGSRVLANTGLLGGRRATSHWSSLKSLDKAYPDVTWVRDRRYVQDGPIISTTGVSASIPASLALVEAIAGLDAARLTADRLGVSEWSDAHQTADFQVRTADYVRGALSLIAFWRHERVEVPVTDGTDEIALALKSDAWQRTFRSKVLSTRVGGGQVRSRRGLIVVVDSEPKAGRYAIPTAKTPPVQQLDATLADMGQRYGRFEVRLAVLGLEYNPPARR